MVAIIAAVDNNLGIGYENKLPWYIKKDLQYFKKLTSDCVVIMGGNTYRSIGKILSNRINIVLSRTLQMKDAIIMRNINQVIDYIRLNDKKEKIFIIGGEYLFKHFMDKADEIYLTFIEKKYKCDRFFPPITDKYKLIFSSKLYFETDTTFRFLKYKLTEKVNNELEYLKLGKHILDVGHCKKNRTEVDTISTFSYQLRFDISTTVPLLTTKRVPWKTCIEELLWFLRGETDVKILQDKGIKIWDGNTSREFLDNMGFYDVEEGDLRKGYGHQIRRYGENQVDQLAYVEKLLKTDPNSRRIMWNLWNASDLDQMVLTPCFTKSNYVITDQGYKQINKVDRKDFLLTHKGNYKRCLDVQESIYHDDIYNIILENNPNVISCTKEHLFYVANSENLNIKTWVEAKDLDHKKHVMFSKINDESVKLVISSDYFYYIGYLFDNCTLEKKYITVDLPRDDTELFIRISNKYKITKTCSCEECNHFHKFTFENTDILKFLKTLRLRQEFLQHLNVEDLKEFLRGYEQKGRTSDTYQAILIIQRLYAKIGIEACFENIQNTKLYKIVEKKPLVDKEYLYYKIKTIKVKKYIEGIKVYNLETEDDHTYIVSNITTHNCHNQIQFYVKDNKYLSAQLYCRSSDYFLGLPFNIFSYTTLIYILAKRCDLIPDELVVTLGDAHIYENHIDQVKEMLSREQRALPALILNDSIKTKNYEDITIDDFKVVGYFPQKIIKGKMAV